MRKETLPCNLVWMFGPYNVLWYVDGLQEGLPTAPGPGAHVWHHAERTEQSGWRICPIHPKTVRNWLRNVNLVARRPYVGLPLTSLRRQRRMNWLRAHNREGSAWCKGGVSWINVHTFLVGRVTSHVSSLWWEICRRLRWEIHILGVTQSWSGVEFPLGLKCIWWWSSLGTWQPSDEIPQPNTVPFVQQNNLAFQPHYARLHAAKVCRDFIAANNIIPLEWSAYNPDLSSIEQWGSVQTKPSILVQLRDALVEEWNNIPTRCVNALMNSMARRIRASTQARGGQKWY